jgi:hypothetical protein
MRTRLQLSYSVPVLALVLLAASLCALSQTTPPSSSPGRDSTASAPDSDSPAASSTCPVTVTSANFKRFATPQPVPAPGASTSDRSYGSLHLEYRNTSDKPVQSFDFSAKLAAEKSFRPPLLRIPEDLSHFTQAAPLGATDASHADYPIQVNARDLIWLRLDKVTFADGSSWTPAPAGLCTYRPAAKVEPAHPVQTSAPQQ